MRYIRYKIEKQQINFLNCNKIDEWIDTCHTRDIEFIDVCVGNCECGSGSTSGDTTGSTTGDTTGSTTGSTTGDTTGGTIRTTVRGNGSEKVNLWYDTYRRQPTKKMLIDGVSVNTGTTKYVFNDNEIHTVDYVGVPIISQFFQNSDIITAYFIDCEYNELFYTFNNCTKLKEVTLPITLKKISSDSFSSCESLSSITIPSGVTTIGSCAFGGLGGGILSSITCLPTKAPHIYNCLGEFNIAVRNGILKVPQGSDYSSWLSYLGSGWKIEYLI